MKKLFAAILSAAMLLTSISAFAADNGGAVDISTKFSDKDNWIFDADKTTIESDKITTTQNIIAYGGEKFGDGSITFSLKMTGNEWKPNEDSNSNEYVGICIRQKKNNDAVWENNRGYLLIFKPAVVELQRWYGGTNTGVFKTVENTFINDHEKHNVEIKTVEDDGAVRYLVAVDGKIVWDFLDDDYDNAITSAGYIGFYDYLHSGTLEIGAFDGELMQEGEISKPEETPEPTKAPEATSEPTQTPGNNGNGTVSETPTKLKINGKYIVTDTNPYIEDDVIMVPIRAIAEAVGGSVGWNSEKQMATINMKRIDMEFRIGSKEYTGGGGPRIAAGKAVVKNDRTMISIDILETQFLADVSWDEETQTAIIDL